MYSIEIGKFCEIKFHFKNWKVILLPDSNFENSFLYFRYLTLKYFPLIKKRRKRKEKEIIFLKLHLKFENALILYYQTLNIKKNINYYEETQFFSYLLLIIFFS